MAGYIQLRGKNDRESSTDVCKYAAFYDLSKACKRAKNIGYKKEMMAVYQSSPKTC